jgi:hypothetical protein
LVVALPVAAWALLSIVLFHRRAAVEVQRNQRVQETYAWLRQQNAHAVLTTHGHYQMYLLFYSQTDGWRLLIDPERRPGVRYDYELWPVYQPPATLPPGQVVLENADVQVYRLPQLQAQ